MKIQAIEPRVSQEQAISSSSLAVQQLGSAAATFNELLKQAGASLKVNSTSLVKAKANPDQADAAESAPKTSTRTERSERRSKIERRDTSEVSQGPAPKAKTAAQKSNAANDADCAPAPSANQDDTGVSSGETTACDATNADDVPQGIVETAIVTAAEAAAPVVVEAADPAFVIAAAAVATAAEDTADANAEGAAQTAGAATANPEQEGPFVNPQLDGEKAAGTPFKDMGHQGKTGEAAQAAADAAASDAARATAAGDAAAQQAADLAKNLKPNERLNVKVSVTDTANTVVSAPASNLSAAAVTAADASAQSQNGQQNTHGGPQPGTPQANVDPNLAQAASAQAAQGTNAATLANGADNRQAGVTAVEGAQGAAATQGNGETAGAAGQAARATEAQQAQKSSPVAQARHAAFRQAVVDQVSVNITKAAADGLDHIKIQLRPASLGRIDVQIDMTAEGHVTAVVTADNKDTLDLLQRDSRSLEKALQDAGLQTDSGSLTFNLRSGGGEQAKDESAKPTAPLARLSEEKSLDELLSPDAFTPRSDKRIDIRA